VLADAYTEASYSVLKEGYESSKNADEHRQLFKLPITGCSILAVQQRI
jgi:hypothetical protein